MQNAVIIDKNATKAAIYQVKAIFFVASKTCVVTTELSASKTKGKLKQTPKHT